MSPEEAARCRHGIYRVWFHHDDDEEDRYGYTLASVGSTYSGQRWLAPCNWVAEAQTRTRTDGSTFTVAPIATLDWSNVERVELIEAWSLRADQDAADKEAEQ